MSRGVCGLYKVASEKAGITWSHMNTQEDVHDMGSTYGRSELVARSHTKVVRTLMNIGVMSG